MLDDLRDMTQPPEMLNATSEEVEEISQCIDDVIAEVRAALTLLEPKQSSSARFSRGYMDTIKRIRDTCVSRARGSIDVKHIRDWPLFDTFPEIQDPTGSANNLLATLSILGVVQDEMEGDQHQDDLCDAGFYIESTIDAIWPIYENENKEVQQ